MKVTKKLCNLRRTAHILIDEWCHAKNKSKKQAYWALWDRFLEPVHFSESNEKRCMEAIGFLKSEIKEHKNE